MSGPTVPAVADAFGVVRLTRGAEQHRFRVAEPEADEHGGGQIVRVAYGHTLAGHRLRVTREPDGSLRVRHGTDPEVLVELEGTAVDSQVVRAGIVSDDDVAGHA